MTPEETMITIMKNAATGVWHAQHEMAKMEPGENRTRYALALDAVAIHLCDVIHGIERVMQ